jgi:hypothetical protein
MLKLATGLRHLSLHGVRPPYIIYYGESTLLASTRNRVSQGMSAYYYYGQLDRNTNFRITFYISIAYAYLGYVEKPSETLRLA